MTAFLMNIQSRGEGEVIGVIGVRQERLSTFRNAIVPGLISFQFKLQIFLETVHLRSGMIKPEFKL